MQITKTSSYQGNQMTDFDWELEEKSAVFLTLSNGTSLLAGIVSFLWNGFSC